MGEGQSLMSGCGLAGAVASEGHEEAGLGCGRKLGTGTSKMSRQIGRGQFLLPSTAFQVGRT